MLWRSGDPAFPERNRQTACPGHLFLAFPCDFIMCVFSLRNQMGLHFSSVSSLLHCRLPQSALFTYFSKYLLGQLYCANSSGINVYFAKVAGSSELSVCFKFSAQSCIDLIRLGLRAPFHLHPQTVSHVFWKWQPLTRHARIGVSKVQTWPNSTNHWFYVVYEHSQTSYLKRFCGCLHTLEAGYMTPCSQSLKSTLPKTCALLLYPLCLYLEPKSSLFEDSQVISAVYGVVYWIPAKGSQWC